MALIYGLAAITTINNQLYIYGDSNMIINIIKKLKITNNFKKHQEYIYYLLQFQELQKAEHKFRENNTAADALANIAIDKKKKVLEDQNLLKNMEKNI